jgi:hypothetical protein
MSSGPFVISRYETDPGVVHPIKVQPETIAASIGGVSNAAPAGAATGLGSASISRGRRANGINARLVRINFEGSPPAGYQENSSIAIPALTPAFYAAAIRGATVSYLGTTGVVSGRSPETIN